MENSPSTRYLFESWAENAKQAVQQLRASKAWATYGWYNFLTEIAQSKVFDKSGYTSMESAMISNFIDAMTFMSNKIYMQRATAPDINQ